MDIVSLQFDPTFGRGQAAGFHRDMRPSRLKRLSFLGGRAMKTRKIDAPNGALAVHESAGRGPPVVFIHGNSSSSRVFSRQLDGPLGQRFRLIAVDLPGHGASDDAEDPSAYSLPGYGRAVRAVLDALGMTRPTSSGGASAVMSRSKWRLISGTRAALSFSARRRSHPARR
jgi:pimeloyl-ACP methyl ester carboxylesterase